MANVWSAPSLTYVTRFPQDPRRHPATTRPGSSMIPEAEAAQRLLDGRGIGVGMRRHVIAAAGGNTESAANIDVFELNVVGDHIARQITQQPQRVAQGVSVIWLPICM